MGQGRDGKFHLFLLETFPNIQFQNGVAVKTPINCDVNFAKKDLHKLTFDSIEEDHSYKKLELAKLNGPKLTAIVHRELDLPIFW